MYPYRERFFHDLPGSQGKKGFHFLLLDSDEIHAVEAQEGATYHQSDALISVTERMAAGDSIGIGCGESDKVGGAGR
ncbi:MAG: hypothetical protein OHK0029_15330 [Armatimonadaceae bacterium]